MDIYNKGGASLVGSKVFLTIVSFVFFIFALFAVYFFEGHVKSDVLGSIDQEFTETQERLKEIVTSSIAESKSDLRFLYSTPPISGLPRAEFNDGIDPYDGTTYNQWKERLETIFIGFMENNLAVEQLRVIAVTAEGRELIRVQRVGASVEAVPDYSLQAKSGEPYFLPSSQLETNQIYMSPLTLNKEFGEVVFPYQPMLRFSIPIFSDKGKRYAFLIMNVNANALIDNLKRTVFNYSDLIISSSEGDFVYHPIEEYQFSRDLNPEITWDKVYSQKVQYQGLYTITSKLNPDLQFYVHSTKVKTKPRNKYGYINFNLLVPEKYVETLINEKREITYSFLAAIGVFTFILLIMFYRNATRSQFLAEARREASAIVDGSIDAIVGLNLEGELTSVNNTAERLLSISKVTALGKLAKDVEFLSKLPIHTYVTDIQSSKSQIKDELSEQFDETTLHYAISVSPVFSEHNTLIGLALIIRDITKEKDAEIKVKRLNTELEAKVRKRTQALAEAKDDAIKHSDIKSAFISNISHELRTPLNGVIGTLNILKREELSGKSRNLVEMMELSASNLNLLINDILDLSKIEAGKLDLNLKTINLQLLIERLVESSAIRAFDKGLNVYLDTSDLNCENVKTDPLRLTQILNNLISNAIKFTDKGYIKVIVSSERISEDTHNLKVNVQDTGIGIAPSTQGQLFDAFQQASTAISEKFGGTGLGLSICKQLCQLMDGDISVSSTLNQGSVFTFNIKVRCSGENSQVTEKCYENKAILVASSNPNIWEVLDKTISLQGGIVSTCSMAEIGAHKSKAFDYVFLDYEDDTTNNIGSIIEVLSENSQSAQFITLHQPGNPLPKGIASKVSQITKPVTQTELVQVAGYEVPKSDPLYLLSETSGFELSDDVIEQLKGCTVLIVDDNEINIEVAKGALDELPINILTASNGRDSIELLNHFNTSEKQINCILMDCQMPILDGYQVCEKIRTGKAGESFIDIPIIAMTASAMAGEKEKCLAVGMSDYVSKPIETVKVLEKVVKWSLSSYEGQSKAIPLAGNKLKEEKLWDREQALARLLNKEVLLNKICEVFVVKVPIKVQELIEQHKKGNSEEVRQIAHALKGMCGEISANKLRELFSDIEVIAEKGNLDIGAQLVTIEQMIPRLVEDIARQLGKL
ncbi:response regulator [Pseudoalteromonas sp. MB41]|uniref:PAS domain-containing hybrid sensor histidine kinase/response regulator n=1 Tax=Pseudoalteromonas sp. MB41 TaxID=2896366 RepID=UPI001E3B930B|nr:ATP-binding protein [Pseudoalteromonas sp. MB41]MCC9662138.1 response regulator [Pseudoalteromonas sp. MB41]